ncbi:MAG: TonB-dependent receptor plug domain-containing protein, partial [Rhodanobacter sp.]
MPSQCARGYMWDSKRQVRRTMISMMMGMALATGSAEVGAQSASTSDSASATNPAQAQSTTQQAPTQPPSSQPSPNKNVQQLQTITVTGSALPRVDTETPSPVTVITAAQIARSGFTTISDVVRSISADNSGTIPNAFTGGFAGGSAGVALRGLTVNSTLVLIDGKRAASYPLADDGERSFVDLNTIPIASVERIEVLK